MLFLIERIKTVDFFHGDFTQSLALAQSDNIDMTGVYQLLDPPYVKNSDTANFTSYSADGFTHDDQVRLVDYVKASSVLGVTSIVCNHYNKVTKKLYSDATKRNVFPVSRTISQNINKRVPVKEMLALYTPTN